jgi:uncharacterized PurR-regulated membrane protein YhhQ (DUF165 family)
MGKCVIRIWTHKINGLTESGFILAAKIWNYIMNNTSDKIYTTLCVLFAVFIIVGNLIYQKFVFLPILPFHTFELSVGAITYPLTFMLTDLIAEFYGKNKANFCVRLAIAMNIIIALVIIMMDKLNATEWSKIDNITFHKVFVSVQGKN